MQRKVSESWDSSSCHSFCSTNEIHYGDVDISCKELEADRPETASLSKEPSRTKEETEVFADTSIEVEEGEIEDSSGVESCDDSHRCRHFEKGNCVYGEKCRFLHQSGNNPGLYRMFDRPRFVSHSVYSRPRLSLKTEIPLPAVSPEKEGVDWDQELKEEMLRVGFSRKKVVPFDELSLTIRTTRAVPASRPSPPEPSLKNKTHARRVRYRSEDEPGLPVSVASKRNNTRGSDSEKTRPSSPKSSRYNKRRYSDTSRSRSRSLSAGRQFSCKCCRTPSPKLGRRRASYRRPICFYRRKSVSSSFSSPSPSSVSRRRVVRRRVRDVGKDPHRKRRGRSRKSSLDRTKIRLYIRGVKASGMRGLGRESQTSKTRRDSKALALPSPKASKIKCSSDKRISPTSQSSAKVDKLAASFLSNRQISDMSISPYSSDSDSEKELDIRFSSIRRPSDMSISTFSDSPNHGFWVPAWKAEEPTSGVAAQKVPTVPRKVTKFNGSAPEKRLTHDVAERNPPVVLPQRPISKSLTPKRRLRSEVRIPEPSPGPREVPKYVDSAHKNILKSDVAKSKLPAEQEMPKFERCIPKIFKNDVAEPKPLSIPQEVPKYVGSSLKNILSNDVAKPKLPAVQQDVPKSERSTPKIFKIDVAETKRSAGTTEISKSMRSNPKNKLENDVAEPKPPVVQREMQKSESSAQQKRFNHLLCDLMKYHREDSSTKVAVNTEAARPLERREMSVTKVGQKSAARRGVSSLSRKEILMKQLQDLTAAIERKRLLAKQKLGNDQSQILSL